MARLQKTDEQKKNFILKPHHGRILETVYKYHFLTVEQVTRLFYSPNTIADVRKVLNALSQAGYLMFLYLPRATPLGAVPKIYTLARTGINHLKQHGYDVTTRFHPVEQEEKSYLFLKHTLAVNDFLIAAQTLEKKFPAITLHAFIHERVLKREEPIRVTFEKITVEGKTVLDKDEKPVVETVRIIPDAFLDFRIAQPEKEKTYRYCMLLELDRNTTEEKSFKKKIRALLTLAKDDKLCIERFGAKIPTIAFANAVGGERRREQMRHWTEQELRKSKEPHFWTQLFMFTDVLEDTAIDNERLFLSPVWYMPFVGKQAVLLSAGSR